jgi:Ca2+-binding RTX toxin-like protein
VLRATGTEAGRDLIFAAVNDGGTGQLVTIVFNQRIKIFNRADVRAIEIVGLGNGDFLSSTADVPSLLDGGAGNDELRGGPANDRLLGKDGNDRLLGNAGDDLLDGGLGTDHMDGGSGADTADYHFRSANLFVDLQGDADDGASGERDTVAANVEHILGGSGSDTLTGNDRPNFIRGNGGNDTIRGGGGNDNLIGDGGQDRVFGEAGDDFLEVRDGITDLVLDGGAGFDRAKKDSSDPRTSIEQLV